MNDFRRWSRAVRVFCARFVHIRVAASRRSWSAVTSWASKTARGQVTRDFRGERRRNSLAHYIRVALRRKSWKRSPDTPAALPAFAHAVRKSRIGSPLGHVNTCASGCFPTQHASTASRMHGGIASVRALLFFVAPAHRLIHPPATWSTRTFLNSDRRNPRWYTVRIIARSPGSLSPRATCGTLCPR
jgi:hypothetical protein